MEDDMELPRARRARRARRPCELASPSPRSEARGEGKGRGGILKTSNIEAPTSNDTRAENWMLAVPKSPSSPLTLSSIFQMAERESIERFGYDTLRLARKRRARSDAPCHVRLFESTSLFKAAECIRPWRFPDRAGC